MLGLPLAKPWLGDYTVLHRSGVLSIFREEGNVVIHYRRGSVARQARTIIARSAYG